VIGDSILIVGIIVSAHLAIERARGVRMLRRAARWPKADQAEIGGLARSYIVATALFALSAVIMAVAVVARHT